KQACGGGEKGPLGHDEILAWMEIPAAGIILSNVQQFKIIYKSDLMRAAAGKKNGVEAKRPQRHILLPPAHPEIRTGAETPGSFEQEHPAHPGEGT
ncbi:MAG TPA: hypothetical protein PKJ13_04115, partial [bacterium]|nr:hypothetical protein [bacterium]